jgi:rubrerythrin
MFTDIKATPTLQIEPSAQDTNRKLWFCEQCGYVTFREEPPFLCPICKAKKEFFKEIKLEIHIKSG